MKGKAGSALNTEVFDYQVLSDALSHYRKPRDTITRLLASETIVRIKKGLYCFGEALRKEPISREYLANLIYGPSYVSLDYALAYHGLIPERVETVTSVIFEVYLTDDLRIDREELAGLDRPRLHSIAHFYDSGKINNLVGYLESLEVPAHA